MPNRGITMKNMIHELYAGNITPCDRQPSEEYTALNEEFATACSKFLPQLTDEQCPPSTASWTLTCPYYAATGKSCSKSASAWARNSRWKPSTLHSPNKKAPGKCREPFRHTIHTAAPPHKPAQTARPKTAPAAPSAPPRPKPRATSSP